MSECSNCFPDIFFFFFFCKCYAMRSFFAGQTCWHWSLKKNFVFKKIQVQEKKLNFTQIFFCGALSAYTYFCQTSMKKKSKKYPVAQKPPLGLQEPSSVAPSPRPPDKTISRPSPVDTCPPVHLLLRVCVCGGTTTLVNNIILTLKMIVSFLLCLFLLGFLPSLDRSF